jgi:hypothetical protein
LGVRVATKPSNWTYRTFDGNAPLFIVARLIDMEKHDLYYAERGCDFAIGICDFMDVVEFTLHLNCCLGYSWRRNLMPAQHSYDDEMLSRK